MKPKSFPENKKSRLFPFVLVILLLSSLTIFSQDSQPAQLSLADILVGLRSKKATLPERNKILADAVKVRGITFTLTPEIEKELTNGGADRELVEAIRQKSPVVKPQPTPVTVVKPQPTPTPAPTAADFQKRANVNITKGEFDLAIADYSKVIEMKAADASVYFNRGFAFSNKKNYDLAIADYDKAIEMNPKDGSVYFNRGDLYEKTGNAEKAIADYQKAVELDDNNEAARNALKRLQDEKAAQQKAVEKPKIPELVNFGSLNALAVDLAAPNYPALAKQSKIQGKVTVQITLDEEGKVISAKAVDGPAMLRPVSEEAIRKSKFKPARVGDTAVKATGFIIYNFKTN